MRTCTDLLGYFDMNERHFLLKCVTPIKSNRNHSICFSLLFPFPFSSSIWILISSAPSWPVWRMLLWSASGQKCFLILYCSHFSLWIIQSPKAHLACGGTVLPLLLTPMSTLAWCGGPGAAAVTTEPSGHPHRCPAWHQGWRSKNNILSPDVSVQGWDREWDP